MVQPSPQLGKRFALALALAPLLIAACGGDVKSTQGTGGRSTQDAGDPKAQPATAGWTMLGYDLGSSYWNKAEKKISRSSVRDLTKAWEYDTRASATATPVISGGRAYLSSYVSQDQKAVVAIDLATGAELWRNSTVGGYSSLALDSGVLYLHDVAGFVHALDAENGTELWAHQTDETPYVVGFSSPIVTKELVLVGGGSSREEMLAWSGEPATFHGFVIALNKPDGTLAWKKYTVEPPHNGAAIWSTLSVDEASGVVVAATGNNYTGVASDTSDALALPLSDGADFIWKQQILEGDVFTSRQSNGNIESDFGANPILFEVGGRKLAAGGNKGGDVWVLDRSDGSIVSKRNLSPPNSFKGGVFNSGAWDGSCLLFAVNGATSTSPGSEQAPETSAATLFALDPLTLDIKWERQVIGPAFSPISVANGVGLFGKNTTLQAFDTATGDVFFEFPTEGTISSAPAIADGYVVFGSGMPWIQTTRGTKYYALKLP